MKGAVIGCGAISEFHFKGWQRVKGAEILAVCDAQEEKARQRAREFGIQKVYRSYPSMLDVERPDFVDVITRPEAHREIVLELVRRRIPTICQKPFAPSLAEAQEMVEVAERAGVPLMVHENWRWRRWYRQIKQWIEHGQLGSPCYAHFLFHSDTVLPDYGRGVAPNLQRYPYLLEMPRLILYEFGIHLVDIFRFLFGEPIRLCGMSRRRSPLVQGEDHVVLLLETETQMAALDLSWGSWGRRSSVVLEEVLIEGDQGYVVMDAESRLRLESATQQAILGPYAPDYAEHYVDSFHQTEQHFYDCLLQGKEFETSGRDNLKTLAITLKAYDSFASGEALRLRQV
jgi:predicted dehydrogenase